MRGLGLGITSGALWLAVSLVPAEAAACGGPAGCAPSSSPRHAQVVPANTPALVIDPNRIHSGSPPLDAGSVVLLDEGGAPVAFTLEQELGPERLLVRPAQLHSGQQYQLSFAHPCYEPPSDQDAGVAEPKGLPSSSAYPERYGVTFEAGPSVPLPTALGTVTVTTAAQVVQAGTSCGSCTAPLAAAVAQLELTPSQELLPFWPTVRLEVTVDGAHWAKGGYGDPAEGVAYSPGSPTRSVQTIFASCGTEDTFIYDLGVSPGPHVIEVRAHLAGAVEQPAPVTLEVELDCSPWDTMERPAEICWLQPQDAGTGPGADGGTDPHQEPPAGGCSGSWFGAATLLGAALFRQRLTQG